MGRLFFHAFVFLVAFGSLPVARSYGQQSPAALVPRFDPGTSGLVLQRPTHAGSFLDVLGRRSAVFGYENRALEVWTYPVKILEDFRLDFQIQDYPLAISGPDIMSYIEVRPEATVLTYTHSAFTVRQIIYAPVDEMGVIMLLDVSSVRPLTVTCSFRPDLSLMWPAGLMTGNLGWDSTRHEYVLSEETQRFVGLVGAPGARDISVMPYQEEPQDVPTRFVIETTPEETRHMLIPIVIAGSVTGMAAAQETYDRLLSSARMRYDENVRYYQDLLGRTTQITTPDDRLNTAFDWARIGTDKGLATNPMLGTGFVAGFRTSGNSERPGFAWFFGRDALWTSFALNAYGDFAATRTALDFLRQFQRNDGKIPHEISQSAGLIPWFTDYPYAWASADATPLFVIAHADYWQASGDLDYVRRNWPSIQKAWQFTAATDTDHNGLVENTGVGHGWVEGGLLHPAHEEIYLEGIWVEACRGLAAMADALGDTRTAALARESAERTNAALEQTYWLGSEGFYAFATRPPGASGQPDAGPLFEEDTVLPAVPMWWGVLDSARAQQELDHIGSGNMAADWGARILSNQSALYDPLSYHYGSVWPLFTGWASMAAYRYHRPHVGYQALLANALLTYQDALGYVTELISGDYNTAFGRSSHHQVWSEAMVVTPAIRGLMGIEVTDAARTLRFAPDLPADWDSVAIRNVAAGATRYDLSFVRNRNEAHIRLVRRGAGSAAGPAPRRIELAPAFPLDASITGLTVNGKPAPFTTTREGDVQLAAVSLDASAASIDVIFRYESGTDVYVRRELPPPGATSQGLRILRSRAGTGRLNLLVEGLGGRTYSLFVRGPHTVEGTDGVAVTRRPGQDTELQINFQGEAGQYVRRNITLPLH